MNFISLNKHPFPFDAHHIEVKLERFATIHLYLTDTTDIAGCGQSK